MPENCDANSQGGVVVILPVDGTTKVPDLLPQLFPPDADGHQMRNFTAEYHLSHFKKIAWMSLNRVTTVEDELYHEAVTQAFSPPVYIPAFTQINPSIQELIKYGIDEKKDALFRVSTKVINDMGLGDDIIRIGDKIVWDGVEYGIQAMHRVNQFANTNIPMELVFICQRWRQGE